MLKDRTIVWIIEYIFGGILVVAPLANLVLHRFVWGYAYAWSTQLFITCLGVILISCASSMRQRMLLGKRIDRLARQMQERPTFPQEVAGPASR